MTVNWLATVLLVPPLNLALLAAFAFFLLRRGAGRVIVGAALVGLIVLALPAVGAALLVSLERLPEPAAADPPASPPGAIVVLGAEVRFVRGLDGDLGEDPSDEDIGPLSLERVRAAAALHRRTGLPILVSGGIVSDEPVAVGTVMARSLADDFGTPPRWVETRSRDTWENARFSADLLRAAGIRTVYVVTHAWHMPRALLAFKRAGITAVPAPVRLDAWPPLTWRKFVPADSAWQLSYYGFHEWIGLAFYDLR
ncbi:MAG: YdcF family protein [Acetobacteraceae bacterium]|nr:YdcF family protein [Acetobacteraceae bacterium]